MNESLESNLRELYHAVKFSDGTSVPLTANWSGTRIYDSRFGWGRLWQWIYSIIEFFAAADVHTSRLQAAILHTETVFKRTLPLVVSQAELFRHALVRSSKGYLVDEDTLASHRRKITLWNRSTGPWVKLASTSPDKIRQIFSDASCWSNPAVAAIAGYQKVIDLENFTGGPLPLAAFRLILKGKPLEPSKTKEMARWIKDIDNNATPLKYVHRGLGVLEQILVGGKEQNIPSALEVYMEEHGSMIFQQPDPKQVRWRHQLKEGSKILCGATEIILGKEIAPGECGSDKIRVYAVANDPNIIAIAAHNCSTLPLLKRRMDSGQEKVTADIKEVSIDGRLARMERLVPVQHISWTSTATLSEADLPYVEAIVQFIKAQVAADGSPATLSPSTWMFDAHKHLKSTRPIIPAKFNFNALEDFAMAASQGNAAVFRALMERSGLDKHPCARFYHDYLKGVLKGDVLASDDLAAIYKISDPRIVDRAKMLGEKVASIHRHAVVELRALRSAADSQGLEGKTAQTLLQSHLSHRSAGTLWPTLLQEVVLS